MLRRLSHGATTRQLGLLTCCTTRRLAATFGVADLGPTIHAHQLQRRVRESPAWVVTHTALSAMAVESGHKAGDVEQVIANLVAAGFVVPLPDEQYHLKPAALVVDYNKAAGNFDKIDPTTKPREELTNLEKEMSGDDAKYQAALLRAARWRRAVWGSSMAITATQLAVISRLTYFDLDWDIMEPVSYFMTSGTAIMFYAYWCWYRKEHTLREFDERYIPRRMRKYCVQEGLDIVKYIENKKKAESLRRQIDAIEKWWALQR